MAANRSLAPWWALSAAQTHHLECSHPCSNSFKLLILFSWMAVDWGSGAVYSLEQVACHHALSSKIGAGIELCRRAAEPSCWALSLASAGAILCWETLCGPPVLLENSAIVSLFFGAGIVSGSNCRPAFFYMILRQSSSRSAFHPANGWCTRFAPNSVTSLGNTNPRRSPLRFHSAAPRNRIAYMNRPSLYIFHSITSFLIINSSFILILSWLQIMNLGNIYAL